MRNVCVSWVWLCILFTCPACGKKSEPLTPLPFLDDFQRDRPGPNWQGDPDWRIENGMLHSAGTRNRPIWLKGALPENAVIEFDARSDSPDGDIKFELYGDGQRHASGYILIFGGWRNSISCIARLDEHGADRQELVQPGQVKQGQTYHMTVIRKDKTIRWFVDGRLLLDYFDSDPLKGRGHDRLAFNNWASRLYFDNLKVRAATEAD